MLQRGLFMNRHRELNRGYAWEDTFVTEYTCPAGPSEMPHEFGATHEKDRR
jgi:hypothetical protein